MLQMDLTQINVLTKIDNIHKYPELPFNLDFYTEVQDLDYLLPSLEKESPMFAQGKFQAMNKAVCQLIEDFGLVGYETLAVEDKKSMMQLLRTVDRASGYVFGGAEGAGDSIWQTAVRQGMGQMDIRDIQDRWVDNKDYWDEKEQQERDAEQQQLKEEFERNAARNGALAMEDDDDEDLNFQIPADSAAKVGRSAPK